jgi:hypothetical protein
MRPTDEARWRLPCAAASPVPSPALRMAPPASCASAAVPRWTRSPSPSGCHWVAILRRGSCAVRCGRRSPPWPRPPVGRSGSRRSGCAPITARRPSRGGRSRRWRVHRTRSFRRARSRSGTPLSAPPAACRASGGALLHQSGVGREARHRLYATLQGNLAWRALADAARDRALDFFGR